MKTRLLPIILLLSLPTLTFAQTGGVGIGTTAPDASAALDISSTSKGLLLPRLSQAQRDALGTGSIAAPVAGLVIYQTDNTPGLYAYDGTAWVRLGADNLGNHTATQKLNLATFPLVGNGGTTGLTVASNGNVGIGTAAAPAAKLEVAGDVRIPAANSYTYASARAGSVMLGAFDFQAENGTTAFTTDGFTDEMYPTTGTTPLFRAPIHLPQGAIITGITLLAYDYVETNITADLIAYQNFTGANRTTLTTASTSGIPGYAIATSPTIARTVDNDNYSYSVRVTFGTTNTSSLTLRGVRVSYTITKVE
jgi:hypothetical protein